jgi:hypothetical protein
MNMTIEDRMTALGLTVKPKRTAVPMEDMDDTTLKAIAKNRTAKDETRVKALDLLEARRKTLKLEKK